MDAILGTTVKVTTVDGPVDLKIPAGTQPGTTLVMTKRGVPKLNNTNARGDHLVHVKVGWPACMHACLLLCSGPACWWGQGGSMPGRAWGRGACGRPSHVRCSPPTPHVLSVPLFPPPPPPLQVRIPKALGSEERKLVESLRDLQAAKPAGAGRGWF